MNTVYSGSCGSPISVYAGSCGSPVFDGDKFEYKPVEIRKKEQTYLDYVRERVEAEKLLNPKKWWEFWR
jgi:hypothetical protein